MVTIKTEKEVALIRESSKIVADVLRLLEKQIYPGIATKDLDALAEDFITEQRRVSRRSKDTGATATIFSRLRFVFRLTTRSFTGFRATGC